MSKKERRTKIPELDTIDIILKRLLGKTLEDIAEEYGVSKQVVQYHEQKELTQELKSVLLNRAAEVAGEVIGQRALVQNALLKGERIQGENNKELQTEKHTEVSHMRFFCGYVSEDSNLEMTSETT